MAEVARQENVLQFRVPAAERRLKVLDLGCGTGTSLDRPHIRRSDFVAAVDTKFESLCLARERHPWAHYVCAAGEKLPFRDSSFDVASCVVALPYMNFPAASAELMRITGPRGKLVVTLHSFAFAFRDLMRRVSGRRAVPVAGALWTLINGVALHCTGRVYRMPGGYSVESWQSQRAVRRAFGPDAEMPFTVNVFPRRLASLDRSPSPQAKY